MPSLLGVSWVQPVWRLGSKVVEGPDEDSFTLLVEAGERLLARAGAVAELPEPARVLVAGDPPSEPLPRLLTAWGREERPITSFPPGELGGYQALSQALEGSEPGATLLLVAQTGTREGDPDRAGVFRSAGAVGLLFGTAPGLRPLGKTGAQRSRAGGAEAPSAIQVALDRGGAEWLRPWQALSLSGEEARSGWEELHRLHASPHPLPAPVDSPAGEEGSDSSLGPARALALVAHQLRARGLGLWLHAREHFVALRSFVLEGPVWFDPAPVPGRDGFPIDPSQRTPPEVQWLEASVSQGAYLSRSRYEESLPTRWRLVGEHCPCGGWTLPPRGRCVHCGASEGLQRSPLPRSGGVLEATTVIHPGAQPSEFDTVPRGSKGFAVGLVRLAPGARVPLQITDQSEPSPAPGRKVETVLRRLYFQEGGWRYGLKARLLPGPPEPIAPFVPPAAVPAEGSPPAPRKGKVPSGRARSPASPSKKGGTSKHGRK
jgi:uncharacterized OB-fold protein